MEEVLKQILSKLDSLEKGQINLEKGQNNLNDKVYSLENKMNDRFNKLEKKVDAIYEQTATLLEFKTDATQKLTAIEGGKK